MFIGVVALNTRAVSNRYEPAYRLPSALFTSMYLIAQMFSDEVFDIEISLLIC